MTQAEKARAYDKVFEQAKNWYVDTQIDFKKVLETLFPELKESEDKKTERILHSISNKISFHLRDIFTDEEFQCFDTWSNAWLEKQGSQNLADKPETAFHEGDWIVQENIGIYKIIEVCESWYEVIDIEDNHYSISFDKEYMCYFWSINDAKDGDVLVADSRPFIYNGSKNEVTVGAYCGFNVEHKFSFAHNYVINRNITPATKEQRDILFKAITDAGYTFDFEKKELKIIDWNKHIKYEPNAPSIIKENPQSVFNEYSPKEGDTICDYIFPELKESEDEKIRQKFIKLVKMSSEVGGFALHKWEADEMLAWLEKQGGQKSAWSREDEKIRQTIINEFKQYSEWYCSNGLTKEDCINWLNKQEYFEWGDEDNENMNSLCVLLDQMVSINAIGNEHSIEYKNWLKSIKQRMGG